jgi:guanyl-specific ribonuclease Sa
VQAWDRFAYTNNNPVLYNNPSGHCVLIEEDSDGLCVITRQQKYDALDQHERQRDSYRTVIQVVHGGTIFVNQTEVGLANYLLTGESKWLNPIPRSSGLVSSLVAVAANLGYETGYGNLDPTLVLMAAAINPGDINNDDGYLPGISKTLKRIKQGGPFPYKQDGQVFQNHEGLLPPKPSDYYREYTVEIPGVSGRGTARIVTWQKGEAYLTLDHYQTFTRIR